VGEQVRSLALSAKGYRLSVDRRLGLEVITTLRRNRDDVFLIGEEQILADPDSGHDTDLSPATEEIGGRPTPRPPRSLHLPGSLQGSGGLALLGLGAGAIAFLSVLELGGGQGPVESQRTSSQRSPSISRSTAGVPAQPRPRVHPRAAVPAEVHRHRVVHHHRPRHPQAPVRIRPAITTAEPEREPTPSVAPVSSATVAPTEPAPAPQVAPAATPEPTPPGPPPSSSSGGPGGVESFGFER
jgi:hypothetical protein